MSKANLLPIEPRLVNREQAAGYVSLSTNKFSELIAAGKMPKPIQIDRRLTWDRRQLDAAIDDLQHSSDERPDTWSDDAA